MRKQGETKRVLTENLQKKPPQIAAALAVAAPVARALSK